MAGEHSAWLEAGGEFGLPRNAEYDQRIGARSGPPTPDDMNELLTRRPGTRVFLAHPRAIAAFMRACNRRGVYPTPVVDSSIGSCSGPVDLWTISRPRVGVGASSRRRTYRWEPIRLERR